MHKESQSDVSEETTEVVFASWEIRFHDPHEVKRDRAGTRL